MELPPLNIRLKPPPSLKNKYFKFKAILGVRDFPGKYSCIVTGLKPYRKIGFLSKKLIDLSQFLLKYARKVNFIIADLEAIRDGVPRRKVKLYTKHFLDWVESFDVRKFEFKLQSENEEMKNLCFELSKLVNINLLRQIYGEKDLGFYMCAIAEVADFLLPYKKRKPLLLLGIDQRTHVYLCKEICKKLRIDMPALVLMRYKQMELLPGKKVIDILFSDSKKEMKEKLLEFETCPWNPENCNAFHFYLQFLKMKEIQSIYRRCKSNPRCLGCKTNFILRFKTFK